MSDKHTQLLGESLALLKGYERWEAGLLCDNEAWGEREFPQLNGVLWGQLESLQGGA